MPDEEKLVNWYSCAFIETVPWQGWMYLSQNHCCFYSYLLGKSKKIIIRWTDIKNLDRIEPVFLPESIVIEVRQNSSQAQRTQSRTQSKNQNKNQNATIKFSNFMTDSRDVYKDIKRLIDQAMRSLIDHDLSQGLMGQANFANNGNVLSHHKDVSSVLKRQMDARAKSVRYIHYFRLPREELLDGFVPCSLWVNFANKKEAVGGTLYLSQNYA